MKILENVSLQNFSTIKANQSAKFMTRISKLNDLKNVYSSDLLGNTKKIVLGMGSNILFTSDYSGIILLMEIKGIKIISDNGSDIFLQVGAGEIWEDLVEYAVSQNLYGIENLAMIPGTAGAAPVQNIGAYGMEVKNVIHEIEVFDTKNLKSLTLNNKDCKFSYRNSLFKQNPQQYIICNVTLKLKRDGIPVLTYKALQEHLSDLKSPSIKDIYNTICEIRNSKLPDPEIFPNLGSFFKNPEIDIEIADKLKNIYPDIPFFRITSNLFRIPAAWLIDKCGWKGKKYNNCGVYSKHALILVNHCNAKGNEILDLAEQIKASVSQKFNIILEFEPHIV